QGGVRERVRGEERVQAGADQGEGTVERAARPGAGEPGEQWHAGRSVRVLGHESEIVEDEGPLKAVEVRKHGSDHDRRKPPAIPPTKHRDGLHAHLNGFGASRAVRFAYAPPGLGLSHRDVSAGPRKEANCWPATGGTHDSPSAACLASLERRPLGATRGEWPPSTRCER